MLHANFTAPNTNPVGISNDIMAAAPGAPYLGYALQRLRHWNRWMGIKYIQVGGAWQRRLPLPLLMLPGQGREGGTRVKWGCDAPRARLLAHLLLSRRPALPPPPPALSRLHVQVMFSTGPMFLTVQYSMFPRRSGVAVVSRPVYGKYEQGPQVGCGCVGGGVGWGGGWGGLVEKLSALMPRVCCTARFGAACGPACDALAQGECMLADGGGRSCSIPTRAQAAFYHLHGSSWHANDAQFIFWMNRHKLMLAVLGVLAAAALAGTAVLRFTRQAARARALKLEE